MSALSWAAAGAAILDTGTSNTALFWVEFRQRILSAIREYNCMAGEKVWSVAEGETNNAGLEIRGEFSMSPHVKFMLDARRRRLACLFSSGSRRHRWTFEILQGRLLRKNGIGYRVDEAVDAVLDHLVTA